MPHARSPTMQMQIAFAHTPMPTPTRPSPRPSSTPVLKYCYSLSPSPSFVFFLTLFFIQKFLSVRRVTTCPPWLSYFIIFFASPHLSIHSLLPARRPHPLVVPRPRSVSIRYVVLPVATPPLLTASYSNSTLWPRV